MIKRLLLTAILGVFMSSAKAQFDTGFIRKNIKICADSMADAFRVRDWDKFTRYSYPAMVGTLGGAKEYAMYIQNMFGQTPASAWKKYETGKILQIIKTEKDYQAVVELKSVVEFEGLRTKATSYLIGESWNGGMFWTFFDSQSDFAKSSMIKPDLDKRLVIPMKEEKREQIKD
jgi:hypothetical protein